MISITTISSSAQTIQLSEKDVFSDSNVCNEEGVVMAFFNGVTTSKVEALISVKELNRLHGDKSVQGDKISYVVLYNPSDFFNDFVETFDQRLKEHDNLLYGRFELFFESLRGGERWWSKIINSIPTVEPLLNSIYERSLAKITSTLAAQIARNIGMNHFTTDPTYATHRKRIDNWLLKGKKLLFVAHSQGNLFANVAYDYAFMKTSPRAC